METIEKQFNTPNETGSHIRFVRYEEGKAKITTIYTDKKLKDLTDNEVLDLFKAEKIK